MGSASDTESPPRTPWRRRPMVLVGAGVLVVVAVAAFLWFRPDKLFVDEVVDEGLPGDMQASDMAAAESDDTDPAGSASGEDSGSEAEPGTGTEGGADEGADAEDGEAAEVGVLAEGDFTGHSGHDTSGQAFALELDDGSRLVRLEDFATDNGPELNVYLTTVGEEVSDRQIADDFVDLGSLRGNIGNQNYELPDDVDLDRYRTVVIWCVRFGVSFGAAELTAQ